MERTELTEERERLSAHILFDAADQKDDRRHGDRFADGVANSPATSAGSGLAGSGLAGTGSAGTGAANTDSQDANTENVGGTENAKNVGDADDTPDAPDAENVGDAEDPDDLSEYDLVESIIEDGRRLARIEASRLVKIAALHKRDCMRAQPKAPAGETRAAAHRRLHEGMNRDDLTYAELAPHLCLGDTELTRLIHTATRLTTRLPGTLKALTEGRLDLRRAQVILERSEALAQDHYRQALAKGLSPESAEHAAANISGLLEERILNRASIQKPANLHKSITNAINRLDPGFAERQNAQALKDRCVSHRTNHHDGTGSIHAYLGASEALSIYRTIDAYARTARHTGSPRTLDQLRADAFTHLILNGHLPDQPHQSKTSTPGKDTENIEGTEGTEGTESAHESGSRDTTVVPAIDPATGDLKHCNSTEDVQDNPAHTCTDHGQSPTADDGPDTTIDYDTHDDDMHRRGTKGPDGAEDSPSTRLPDSVAPSQQRPAEQPLPLPPDDPGHPGQPDVSTRPGAGPNDDAGASTGPGGSAGPNSSAGGRTGPNSSAGGRTGPSTGGGTAGSAGDRASAASGGKCRCGGRSGVRADVQVIVSRDTLMGLNDNPAELVGHGPITARVARDLAFNPDSTWRRLVTDPVTGYLLNYGRTTYRPPAALADHVRSRDHTCRHPGCERPAARSHLDHIIAYPVGTTSDTNLNTKCDRDHRLKHEGRWHHRLSADSQHPPGTVIITSPTGHVFLTHPHSYNDDYRTQPATRTKPPPLPLPLPLPDSSNEEQTADDHDPSGPPPF